MIIRSALMLALLALVVPPAMAQAPRRQLEAHTHGEGRLAIAIEGNRVQMELEAPASDIVGFEHAPRTATQRKTLAEAKERLAKAETLFVLSAAAGCRLASAEVAAVGALAGAGTAHKHGDHDHAKDEKGKASAKGADKGDGEGAHSEVRANYAFDCADVAKLGSIAFEYFKAFKGADKLDVTVIAPKGQSGFVVTRKKPLLDLAGLS